MGQLTCSSTGATPGLNATTGTGSPTADIIDIAQTSSGYGISVTSSSASNPGIYSSQTGGASGVHGHSSTSGGAGVQATASSASGNALLAQNTAAAGSSTGNGFHALTAQSAGSAIWAQNTNGGNGITAQNSNGGTAVSASTTDTSVACLDASNASTSGNADGAFVTAASSSGIAVLGESTSTSTSGTGPTGIYGSSASGVGYGLYGVNTATSNNGIGIYALGWKYSVYADSPGSATGVSLYANGGATFAGSVTILGSLSVSGAKNFVIDHPLDPANKYLTHACVESPERKTVYDGVVEADGLGEVTVTLPAYFEALNGDFRYQLTALGDPSPELHVKREVSKGHFVIAGARPKQRVSWQVTGVRRDAWAAKNPMIVEADKGSAERGLYLNPEAHGASTEKRVGGAEAAEMKKRREKVEGGLAERARLRAKKR